MPPSLILLDGPPLWVPRLGGQLADVFIDFKNGRGYQAGIGIGTPDRFVTVSRASTAYQADAQGSFTQFGSNVLRRRGNGALIEEARTNVLIQSSDLTNANWVRSNQAAGAAGGQADPAGGTTAYLSIPNTTSTTHQVFPAAQTLTAAAYTWSVYAKPAGYNFAQLIAITGTGSATRYGPVIDLTTGNVVATGTQGSPAGTNVVTTVYPNGWVFIQVTMTATATASGSQMSLEAVPTNSPTFTAQGAATYAGDGVSGVDFWQPQIELGSSGTSPIPTTTTSIQRAADGATLTTLPAFGSAYSLFSKGTPLAPSTYTANQFFASIADGTANNRVDTVRNSAGVLGDTIVAGGVALQSSQTVSGATGASHRIAVTHAPSDNAYSANGNAVVSNTNAGAVAAPTVVHIGSNSVGVAWLDGYVESMAIWATLRGSNPDLVVLTGAGGP